MNTSPAEISKAKKTGLLSLVDLTRNLDIIFWNLLAFYVILISTFQSVEVSAFPFLSCLPLFCVAYVTFKISASAFKDEKYAAVLRKMRVYSLVAAFNYPFFIFIQSYDSLYFLICTFIAMAAFYLFLTEEVALCAILSEKFDDHILARECRKTGMLIYVSAVLFTAYLIMTVQVPLLYELILSMGEWGRVIEILLFVIIMFPLMLPLTLLFRLRLLLVQNYREKMSVRND